MDDDLSPEWIRRLADGDPVAAAEFFQRYGEAMRQLASRNMGPRLRQRLDPDDIVQSACRSFFRGMEGGRFEFEEENDLWRLLCAITLNKTRNQSRFHGRQRRDSGRQEALHDGVDESRGLDDPAWIVAWQDSVEEYLASLGPEQQQVIRMLLEGHTQVEIARQMGCAERTVRRIVAAIREQLKSDSHFQ